MSILSDKSVKALAIAVTDIVAGNDVATKLNQADALASASSHTIANVIVATNVSATIDFASLAVGDRVLILPAVAGNSMFVTVATAATLPQAAVVGSLYVVLRPTATALTAAITAGKF